MTAGQEAGVIPAAVALCEERRAFYIVDAPSNRTLANIGAWANAASQSRNAATYFPPVRIVDPLDGLRPRSMAPSGTLAGVYARTDATRGVWKAPAGTEATLNGVLDLALPVNDLENGQLNPLGVNCCAASRSTAASRWGARTLEGADAQADEYKYIPIRRLALFLEESLYRGTQWVVFEPNDEPLWAQIRLNLGAFMNGLFRQGAFQGKTPQEAYFVKCDKETTTQADRNLGIVNIVVGLRAAEAGRVRRHHDPADRRRSAIDEESEPWPSSPSTPIASIRTRTSSSASSGTAATWPASARWARSSARTEVVEHREGGDPSTSRKSPGRTKYDAITLERGVTHDLEFEDWANKVWHIDAGLGAEVSLKDFRKDIILEVYNEAGQLVLALQDLPLLGLGVPGAARSRRQRQRDRDPDAQARERGLGARRRRDRAGRTASPRLMPRRVAVRGRRSMTAAALPPAARRSAAPRTWSSTSASADRPALVTALLAALRGAGRRRVLVVAAGRCARTAALLRAAWR